jgi:hypothetical protein
MVYSNQNAAFRNDKHQFFSQIATINNIDVKIEAIDTRTQTIGYSFLLQNQQALELEFTEMFAVLQKKDKNKEVFWLYCYYCASLLEAFYRAYSQHGKEAHFKNIKKEIKQRLTVGKTVSPGEEAFIDTLYHSFLSGFRNLVKSPFHVSQIRDYVAYANLCRIYWVFCRLTLTQGLTIAKELQLIEKLDMILGTHTDVDKIIAVFQAPIGVINYFSVGFFLIRFMIDGGLLLRHTFFPSALEKGGANGCEVTTRFERFKSELYKRHCNFANDFVWATVNFLTNFNHITKIPGPIAGYITSVFLIFDIGMTLYKCRLAKQEYLLKKAQYLEEIAAYETNSQISAEQKSLHIEMLQKQLIELEISWRTKEATFHFCAAAAALLCIGFTASMLVSPPLLIAAIFFTCTFAVAMYLSSGAYSSYKEKGFYLEQAQGINLAAAQKEYEIARNEFIFSLTKNTLMPMILITTFAICWPAAVVLTAMYVGYELFHAYSQHSNGKIVKQLTLEAAVDETACLVSP